MADNKIKIDIEAVDNFSATIKKLQDMINKLDANKNTLGGVRSGITDNLNKIERSFKQVGQLKPSVSNEDYIKQLKKLQSEVEKTVNSLQKLYDKAQQSPKAPKNWVPLGSMYDVSKMGNAFRGTGRTNTEMRHIPIQQVAKQRGIDLAKEFPIVVKEDKKSVEDTKKKIKDEFKNNKVTQKVTTEEETKSKNITKEKVKPTETKTKQETVAKETPKKEKESKETTPKVEAPKTVEQTVHTNVKADVDKSSVTKAIKDIQKEVDKSSVTAKVNTKVDNDKIADKYKFFGDMFSRFRFDAEDQRQFDSKYLLKDGRLDMRHIKPLLGAKAKDYPEQVELLQYMSDNYKKYLDKPNQDFPGLPHKYREQMFGYTLNDPSHFRAATQANMNNLTLQNGMTLRQMLEDFVRPNRFGADEWRTGYSGVDRKTLRKLFPDKQLQVQLEQIADKLVDRQQKDEKQGIYKNLEDYMPLERVQRLFDIYKKQKQEFEDAKKQPKEEIKKQEPVKVDKEQAKKEVKDIVKEAQKEIEKPKKIEEKIAKVPVDEKLTKGIEQLPVEGILKKLVIDKGAIDVVTKAISELTGNISNIKIDKNNIIKSISETINEINKTPHEIKIGKDEKYFTKVIEDNIKKASKEVINLQAKIDKVSYDKEALSKFNKEINIKALINSIKVDNDKLQKVRDRVINLQAVINSIKIDNDKLNAIKNKNINLQAIINSIKIDDNKLNVIKDKAINLQATINRINVDSDKLKAITDKAVNIKGVIKSLVISKESLDKLKDKEVKVKAIIDTIKIDNDKLQKIKDKIIHLQAVVSGIRLDKDKLQNIKDKVINIKGIIKPITIDKDALAKLKEKEIKLKGVISGIKDYKNGKTTTNLTNGNTKSSSDGGIFDTKAKNKFKTLQQQRNARVVDMDKAYQDYGKDSSEFRKAQADYRDAQKRLQDFQLSAGVGGNISSVINDLKRQYAAYANNKPVQDTIREELVKAQTRKNQIDEELRLTDPKEVQKDFIKSLKDLADAIKKQQKAHEKAARELDAASRKAAQALISGKKAEQSVREADTFGSLQQLANMAKTKPLDTKQLDEFKKLLEDYRRLTDNTSSNYATKMRRDLGIDDKNSLFNVMAQMQQQANEIEKKWRQASNGVVGSTKPDSAQTMKNAMGIRKQYQTLAAEAQKYAQEAEKAWRMHGGKPSPEFENLRQQFQGAMQNLVNFRRNLGNLSAGAEANIYTNLARALGKASPMYDELIRKAKKLKQEQKEINDLTRADKGGKGGKGGKGSNGGFNLGDFFTGITQFLGRSSKGFGSFLEAIAKVQTNLIRFGGYFAVVGTAAAGFTATVSAVITGFNLVTNAAQTLGNILMQIGQTILQALQPGIELYKQQQHAIFSFTAALKSNGIVDNDKSQFNGQRLSALGKEGTTIARGLSAELIERATLDAEMSAFSLEELLRSLQGTLPLLLGRGMSVEQAYEVNKGVAGVAKMTQLAPNQILQETRDLAQGSITSRTSQVANALGITNEDIASYKGNADALFNFLMEKFKEYGELLSEFEDTAVGRWQQLQERYQNVTKNIVEGIAPMFKGVFEEIIAWTGEYRDKNGNYLDAISGEWKKSTGEVIGTIEEVTKAKDHLGVDMKSAKFYLSEDLEKVKKALIEIIEYVAGVIDATIQWGQELLGTADPVAVIKQLILDIVQAFMLCVSILGAIIENFATIYTTAIEFVDTMISVVQVLILIKSIFKGIGLFLVNIVKRAIAFVRVFSNLGQLLHDGITPLIHALYDNISNIVKMIKAILSGDISGAASIGLEVANNVKNQYKESVMTDISDLMGSAEDFVDSTADLVLDPIRAGIEGGKQAVKVENLRKKLEGVNTWDKVLGTISGFQPINGKLQKAVQKYTEASEKAKQQGNSEGLQATDIRGVPKPDDGKEAAKAAKQALKDAQKALKDAIEKLRQDLKDKLDELKEAQEQDDIAFKEGFRTIKEYYTAKAAREAEEARLRLEEAYAEKTAIEATPFENEYDRIKAINEVKQKIREYTRAVEKTTRQQNEVARNVARYTNVMKTIAELQSQPIQTLMNSGTTNEGTVNATGLHYTQASEIGTGLEALANVAVDLAKVAKEKGLDTDVGKLLGLFIAEVGANGDSVNFRENKNPGGFTAYSGTPSNMVDWGGGRGPGESGDYETYAKLPYREMLDYIGDTWLKWYATELSSKTTTQQMDNGLRAAEYHSANISRTSIYDEGVKIAKERGLYDEVAKGITKIQKSTNVLASTAQLQQQSAGKINAAAQKALEDWGASNGIQGWITDEVINQVVAKYGTGAEAEKIIRLVLAIMTQESHGNQSAISPAGAIGLMQLMPDTAQGLGVNPYDWQQNIDGGKRFIKSLLDQFGGDVTKVMAGYNAGPGAVKTYGGVPPYKETQDYVSIVGDNFKALSRLPKLFVGAGNSVQTFAKNVKNASTAVVKTTKTMKMLQGLQGQKDTWDIWGISQSQVETMTDRGKAMISTASYLIKKYFKEKFGKDVITYITSGNRGSGEHHGDAIDFDVYDIATDTSLLHGAGFSETAETKKYKEAVREIYHSIGAGAADEISYTEYASGPHIHANASGKDWAELSHGYGKGWYGGVNPNGTITVEGNEVAVSTETGTIQQNNQITKEEKDELLKLLEPLVKDNDFLKKALAVVFNPVPNTTKGGHEMYEVGWDKFETFLDLRAKTTGRVTGNLLEKEAQVLSKYIKSILEHRSEPVLVAQYLQAAEIERRDINRDVLSDWGNVNLADIEDELNRRLQEVFMGTVDSTLVTNSIMKNLTKKGASFGLADIISKLEATYGSYISLGYRKDAQEIKQHIDSMRKSVLEYYDKLRETVQENWNMSEKIFNATPKYTSTQREFAEREIQGYKAEAELKVVDLSIADYNTQLEQTRQKIQGIEEGLNSLNSNARALANLKEVQAGLNLELEEEKKLYDDLQKQIDALSNTTNTAKKAELESQLKVTQASLADLEVKKKQALQQKELLELLKKQPEYLADVANAANEALDKGLNEMLTDGVNSAKSLGELLRDLAVSVLKEIQRVSAKWLVKGIMNKLVGRFYVDEKGNSQMGVQATTQALVTTNTILNETGQRLIQALGGGLNPAQTTTQQGSYLNVKNPFAKPWEQSELNPNAKKDFTFDNKLSDGFKQFGQDFKASAKNLVNGTQTSTQQLVQSNNILGNQTTQLGTNVQLNTTATQQDTVQTHTNAQMTQQNSQQEQQLTQAVQQNTQKQQGNANATVAGTGGMGAGGMGMGGGITPHTGASGWGQNGISNFLNSPIFGNILDFVNGIIGSAFAQLAGSVFAITTLFNGDTKEKLLSMIFLELQLIYQNVLQIANSITAGMAGAWAKGGLIKPLKLASGGTSSPRNTGFIRGAGTATSDSIPAMLSNGEYVINAKSTSKYGRIIEAINNDTLGHYAKGGFIGGILHLASGGGATPPTLTPPGGGQPNNPNNPNQPAQPYDDTEVVGKLDRIVDVIETISVRLNQFVVMWFVLFRFLMSTFTIILNQLQEIIINTANLNNVGKPEPNLGFANGGIVYKNDGMVHGYGTSTSDDIPAMLSNGEAILNAKAVKKLGTNFINAVNNGEFSKIKTTIPHFASGGVVGEAQQNTARGITDFAKGVGTNVSNNNNISIALVRDEQEAMESFMKSPAAERIMTNFQKKSAHIFFRN